MSASLRALIFPLLLYFLVALALPTPARASDDWLPISPEELKMTAEPKAPGASIPARTIHPDGSIVNFNGNIYDKTIIKAKGLNFLAKTFTMPDVQVGSIIEYRYTTFRPDGYISDSRWVLSEELFTKQAQVFFAPE